MHKMYACGRTSSALDSVGNRGEKFVQAKSLGGGVFAEATKGLTPGGRSTGRQDLIEAGNTRGLSKTIHGVQHVPIALQQPLLQEPSRSAPKAPINIRS